MAKGKQNNSPVVETAIETGGLSETQADILKKDEQQPSETVDILSPEAKAIASEADKLAAQEKSKESDAFNTVLASIKANIAEREINGQKYPASSIILDIGKAVMAGTISEPEGARMRQLLATTGEENNAPSNNAPSLADELAEEIKLNIPAMTEEEFAAVKTELADTALHLVKQDLEFEGNFAAKFSVNVCKIARRAVDEGMLVLTTHEKTHKALAAESLWKYIRENELLGAIQKDPVIIGEGTNKFYQEEVTYNPYDDYKIKQYAMTACKRACLYAISDRSQVTFGYLQKTVTNKGLRPQWKHVLLSAIPKDADPTEYMELVAIPANKAEPWQAQARFQKVDMTAKDGSVSKVPKVVFYDRTENEDNSLRPFNDAKMLEGFYQHYFAGWELDYETELPTTDAMPKEGRKLPTGLVIGAIDPKAAPVVPRTPGGETGQETSTKTPEEKLADLAKENIKIRGERDTALAGLDAQNPVRTLQALVAKAESSKAAFSEAEGNYVVQLTKATIKRWIKTAPLMVKSGETVVMKQRMRALVSLYHMLEEVIVQNDDDSYALLAFNQDVIFTIKSEQTREDGAPASAEPKAA
jgi:hypothetical protein